MNITVASVLEHALRAAGRLGGPKRTAGTSENAEALELLNGLIDTLNTDESNIFTVRVDQWDTASHKQSYTLGPDGDWDGPRPQRITRANLLLPTSPTLRRPLHLYDDAQWANVRLQEVYTYPRYLYNDGASPLSAIYFFPIPDATYQIELYTWQALTTPVTAEATLELPPGYAEALKYELAVRVCVAFGAPVNPEVKLLAAKAMYAIQTMNGTPARLSCDPAVLSGGGFWNWRTGQIE